MTAPSKSLSDDLSALTWLPPWQQLEPEQARAHESTLSNSLSDQHPLHGRQAKAVADRSDDADDVLFLVGPAGLASRLGPDELCVVNLGSGKHSASKPFFVIYGSVSEFEQACMLPDHLEYTDDDV